MLKAFLVASTLLSPALLTKAAHSSPTPISDLGKPSLNGDVIKFPLQLTVQKPPPNQTTLNEASGKKNEPENIKWNFESVISMGGFDYTQHISMIVDINYQNILIPIMDDQSSRAVGLKCTKGQRQKYSSCVYYSDQPLENTMEQDHWTVYDQKPKGFIAKNSWLWSPKTIFEEKGFEIGALTTSPDDWALVNAGVLGMGSETSTTSLWTYLFEVSTPEFGYFYTSFYLNTSDTLDVEYNRNFYWYQVFNPPSDEPYIYEKVFNGSEFRISDNLASILDDPVQADFSPFWVPNLKGGSKSQTWGLGNVTVSSSDQKDPLFSNINICFAMNSNSTFLLTEKMLGEFQRKSLDSVCRGAKCGPGSFLLNSAEITLSMKDIDGKDQIFTISPGAYLYNNASDYVQVSADLIEKYKGSGCDPALDNQLGLGKMFFYNYQVVFRMSTGGSADIGFFNYKSRPRFAHYAKVDTLVVTGLVFVLFLFVCIMGLRWKGISEGGEEDENEKTVHDSASYKLAATVPTEGEGEEEKPKEE